MVKWTKVNNEEEHRKLIEVWGDKVDSINLHKKLERSYPYWFSNKGSRQSNDDYIEKCYSNDIVPFEEIFSQNTIETCLW